MPKPIGSVASVQSWVGAKDMTGNVWEWTSSIRSAYPYDAADGRENPDDTNAERVMRGGAFGPKLEMSGRTTMRSAQTGVKILNDVGFRCVRDVQ
jgi:formylglycine-generating enzyme required for sulfatase activity